MIQLRRHPVLAVSVPALGLLVTIAGLYVESIWMIAPGIMAILLGALMIVNPVVVVDADTIKLHNLFGMAQASFPHDGLEFLDIEDNKLFIQHENRRAHLKMVDPKMLHAGDWRNMKEALTKAREHAQKAKKTASKAIRTPY